MGLNDKQVKHRVGVSAFQAFLFHFWPFPGPSTPAEDMPALQA